jgi:ribonuclease T1
VQSATDGSNTTSYALDDALGSVRGLTDASGNLSGSTAYDAFGAVRAQTGSSLALGFTGALTDPTTGFLDLRARDLDPTLGRFLSADTVSPNAPGTQGYDPYAYVANNPTTWTDPSGHDVMSFGDLANLAFGAELLTVLAVNPEFVGLVAVGIIVAVIFLGVAAILSCALDTACRDRFEQDTATIGQYGSGAAAGAWALSGQATHYGWQHFPGLPTGTLCALGAAESSAETAVINAVSNNHGKSSDYALAAAVGCVTANSGGGLDEPPSGQGTAGNRHLPFADSDRLNEVNKTLDRIESGGPFPYAEDGGVFENRQGLLPSRPENYYREYTVDTPSKAGRQLWRIIQGTSGETYYTDDHYRSFVQIDPRRYP